MKPETQYFIIYILRVIAYTIAVGIVILCLSFLGALVLLHFFP